tara:strand:+ start:407 stop:613 length:207 start_codon:yes stop_codon:yes gene_type:complete
MFCSKCGSQIDAEDNFCSSCGAKIIRPSIDQAGLIVNSGQKSRNNSEDDRFVLERFRRKFEDNVKNFF